MEPQFLRAYRADDQASDSGPIRFVASTENVARDGMVINSDAWDLTNYRKNPVVLWSHDYFGARAPIGTAEVSVEKRALIADVTFDADDPFAADIERKVRKGFLSAVSVGWNTLEFAPAQGADGPARVTKADLLDISVVPVPSDPAALKERQKRALADYGRDLIKLIDDEPEPDPQSEELTWHDTVVRMAHVFHPDSGETDDDRQTVYRGLARTYKRLGKTPPEFRSTSDLDALSVDERRGLFLEGEPDLFPHLFPATRAGAVLSKRNADDLSQAIDLIQGVIARAGSKADQDVEEERQALLLASIVKGA